MTRREWILNHYEKFDGEFEYVQDADDYIDRIEMINDCKVAFVNCSDWFEQYELEDYNLEDEIETEHGFYCPYSLLKDIFYYVNEFDDGRYEVFVLDNACCTYVDTLHGYKELCEYILCE